MIFKKNKIFVFLFLLFPLILILNIYSKIPSKIVLSENSSYSICVSKICEVEGRKSFKAVATDSDGFVKKKDNTIELDTSRAGNYDFKVSLFGKIPIKSVSVTVLPESYVVASGETIGIKIYADGLLIVSMDEFSDKEGNLVCPAREAGLKEGDRIVLLNGEKVNSTEQLSRILQKDESAQVEIIRNDEKFTTTIFPKLSKDESVMKIGAWVRDSTAGIGTMTFIDPKENTFAALGHAVCDADTGDVMKVRTGNILSCEILSITKGKTGEAGEIVGRFADKTFGKITKNTNLGIFGTIANQDEFQSKKAYPIATRNEIKTGKASILSNVDGQGVREYSAEILKISKSSKVDNKGLIIKITDPELIEKTGGIVQGMSGSPILQNDKLVGAVTHVFVNDPTRGYGIFIENMLSEVEN